MLEPLHPQAEWGNLGWRLLPWCILNTLPNSVHFAFDGEVAFWVFLSRDADLMDCDFSPDLLFKKKKKSSIKKATQNFYLLREKKKSACYSGPRFSWEISVLACQDVS